MFIQLTRTDGHPVWLNASFIVTVEPARGGGSIVVPIGDGLDYEVREKPEAVLAVLDGAPPAVVVPVPPPKALTPRPDDVSPDTDIADRGRGAPAREEPAKKPRKTKASSKKKKAGVPEPSDAAEPADAPSVPDGGSGVVPVPEDFGKIVADLKRRKCRTAKRMRNAIKSFFGKKDDAEIDGIMKAMVDSGYMNVESDGHVNWLERSAD